MGLDPSAPLAARSAFNRAEWRVVSRYIVLLVRLRGTVKTVPYKLTESLQYSPIRFIKNFPLPLTSVFPYVIVCLLVVTNLIQLPPFSISRPARVPPVPGGFMELLVSIC